jgi:hypothetical protein
MRARILSSRATSKHFSRPHIFFPRSTLYSHTTSLKPHQTPPNQTTPLTTANMSKNWTQETFTLNTVSN